MAAARSGLQAIAVGGKIYAVGGNVVTMKDGKPEIVSTTGINQVYDPASDSWRDLAPMPKGSTHNGIAALNGKIYIAGGFAARGHAKCTDRSFPTTRHKLLAGSGASSSPAAGAPALIALGGKIHIVGGRNGHTDGAGRRMRSTTHVNE